MTNQKVKRMPEKKLETIIEPRDLVRKFFLPVETLSAYDPIYKVIRNNKIGSGSSAIGAARG